MSDGEDDMQNGTRFRLDGKAAIVTGASSGIGAGIAEELARAGATVTLVGRDEGRLDAVAGRIGQAGGRARAHAVDLCAPGAPAAIVDQAAAATGRIDVLVHAAGVFLLGAADESLPILDRSWDVNVRAPYALTLVALEALEGGGAIVFLSSIAGKVGIAEATAYCTTKGAIEQMTRSLAVELAPRGIRVNAVAPGNVRTPMNAHLLDDEDYAKTMLQGTPQNRIGAVDEIAPLVLMLASAEASFMTGASVTVDGGWVAQ